MYTLWARGHKPTIRVLFIITNRTGLKKIRKYNPSQCSGFVRKISNLPYFIENLIIHDCQGAAIQLCSARISKKVEGGYPWH